MGPLEGEKLYQVKDIDCYEAKESQILTFTTVKLVGIEADWSEQIVQIQIRLGAA